MYSSANRIRYIVKPLFLCFGLLISLSSTVIAAQQIGTGQTNDNKTVIIYSDGTWKYNKNTGTKKQGTISYKKIKEKVIKLCGSSHGDQVLGIINIGTSVSKSDDNEKYLLCVDEGTGCNELLGLAGSCMK